MMKAVGLKRARTVAGAILTLLVIAHGAGAGPGGVAGVSGADALTKLLDGNQRYAGGASTHPNQSTQRRTDLANGQHPFATVLGCSHSRVPPELVFDQGLG